MNIQEEKKFIYEMMKDITKERRKLTDIYYGLKERLDFLNKQEELGLDELDLKGYVDLHNETRKELMINNIKRETENIIENISHNNIEESQKIEKSQSEIRHQEIQKDVLVKKRKITGRTNVDKVISNIVMVLKEAGRPMKLKEIYGEVNKKIPEENLTYENFQANIIKKARKNHGKISSPMRGYYQYDF